MTWLERICAVHQSSERPAVIGDAGPVSGRDLIGQAIAGADLLADLDVQAGQPIPALLTTNARALALLLGGAAANRPLAPLGPRMTAAELGETVRRSGSPVLLTEHAFAETARQVADAVGIRAVPIPFLPVSRRPPHPEPGPTSIFLHTAGTTGVPKRVPLSELVLDERSTLLRQLIGIGPDDRYATGSPLHHIGGLGNVLVALTAGAAVICTTKFSFDWWRNLKRFGATHCLLVPTMIEMLLSEGLLDAVPLETLIYGAAPITVDTLRRVLDVLPDVAMVSLYGQTEGSPISSLGPDDHRWAAARDPDVLSTVGRPVTGLRLRIDEPDRAGVGEVFAAATHLSVQDADGWLHTGDLGVVDADGYLHLRGRRHDMVVRGGENIYPLEVENVLSAHPAVAAVGVVGVPETRLGETLAAFIVPMNSAHPPRPEELGAFARLKLAGFKIPQYWYAVAELPLNSAGKVSRAALRASHLERQHKRVPVGYREARGQDGE
ncbi:class I adenylate-forming enzyme family protein [Mycobacterium avium]|uniref:class I adenylate-forming enzyme family protein n=1 Tax=Mycobacterium avium TaxID=1764 RepID=UPI000BB03916|nr:class I adenylate-forming enzyme family protein [Mycobacterium avium]PBA16148.1 acyl-CoA synthetase [Mycobacterium avium]PBA91157.1 acyl-CoA synthetase [Mycobacterium avium]PBJ52123.1 acyl-CoA synthetase [Mycobacterium avium subsp. hominissuis]